MAQLPISRQDSEGATSGEGNMKLFKEERIGDVIYNIYLKKVRYKTSSASVLQETEEEISYLEWETQKIYVIKAATLEKLVEYLPAAVEMLDSTYISVFFSTYQSFASTTQVLTMLLERYNTLDQKTSMEERTKIQRNIRSVLMMWLDENLDDFREPPKYPCLQCLSEFAHKTMSDKELVQRSKLKISQFQDEEHKKKYPPRPMRLYQHDDEVENTSRKNKYTDLNHVDSHKLAEQLTILDASCREMKNFSSSKAIISGLQAQPVYRLRKAWAAVPKTTMVIFDDLANIFMDDNNFEVSREILNKEGTAKFAYIESPRIFRKPSVQNLLARRISSDKLSLARRDSGRMHGTVPYLGTFLSDLIKIDAAHLDSVADGLINFDKRRKEFEVIAQIKLLQNSAKNYQFDLDPNFREWFQDINILDYEECCEISELIEAPPVTLPNSSPISDDRSTRPKTLRRWLSYSPDDFKARLLNGSTINHRSGGVKGHRGSSSSSLSSNSSQESGHSHDSGNSSLHEALDQAIKETKSRAKRVVNKPNFLRPRSISLSKSMTDLSRLPKTSLDGNFKYPLVNSRIIRVSLEEDTVNNLYNIYKSIVVTDHDHTPNVIRIALDKYHLEEEESSGYTLIQNLPQGPALVIPDDANVFYGMNSAVEKATFILKKKDVSDPQHSLGNQQPKIFSKNNLPKNLEDESTCL